MIEQWITIIVIRSSGVVLDVPPLWIPAGEHSICTVCYDANIANGASEFLHVYFILGKCLEGLGETLRFPYGLRVCSAFTFPVCEDYMMAPRTNESDGDL
jgi:hypothetical protein